MFYGKPAGLARWTKVPRGHESNFFPRNHFIGQLVINGDPTNEEFYIVGYVRLIRPWALYVLLLILGAALTWMWSTTKWSVSSPLNSALLSAFFNSWSRNSADFLGHRPWHTRHCLHYKIKQLNVVPTIVWTHKIYKKKAYKLLSHIHAYPCTITQLSCTIPFQIHLQ